MLRCQLVHQHTLRSQSSAAVRFRYILEEEFARRKGSNPRYLLRICPVDWDGTLSTVSQLLREKRSITTKSVDHIGTALRWNGAAVLRAGESTKFDSRRIARRLNISVDEVNLALTDLCMLGSVELKGESLANSVVQWQVITQDLGKHSNFYADVFGWDIHSDNALGYRMVANRTGEGIGGGFWPAPPGAPVFIQLFIQAEDIVDTIKRVREASGEIIIPA